jgi:hypothetical protein
MGERHKEQRSTPNAGEKGVKGTVSPCGVQGQRPCNNARKRKKAQDAVLHLQRGEAPLNPFGMGERHKEQISTPNAGEKKASLK